MILYILPISLADSPLVVFGIAPSLLPGNYGFVEMIVEIVHYSITDPEAMDELAIL